MNGFWDNLLLDVLTLVVVGVLFFAVLGAARFVLRLLPMSRARSELLDRAWPVAVAVAALLFLLLAAQLLLDRAPGVAPLAGFVVFGVLIALAWGPLRDAVAGVILRATRVCRVGDFVHVGEVQGRVERMGWRAMVVRTPSGNEAIIPHSRIARESVLRSSEQERISPHVFQLPVPEGRTVGSLKAAVRRAALLSHWSSVVREPEIELAGEECLEVTVFALDGDRGYEIEAAVRRATRGAELSADVGRGLAAQRRPPVSRSLTKASRG